MSVSQSEPKTQLDARLVNAIVLTTTDVLQTMANTPVVLKQVFAHPGYQPVGDISAFIDIVNKDRQQGVFVLSFPMNLASRLIGNLTGVMPEKIGVSDRCDGVGELMNIIAGNIKAILAVGQEDTVYHLTLPSIIMGQNHAAPYGLKDVPYLVARFEANNVPFQIQVAYHEVD